MTPKVYVIAGEPSGDVLGARLMEGLKDLTGGDAGFNARALEAVLSGDDRGAHRDALVLGAALVLELTGRTPSLTEGIELANAAIDDGSGRAVIEKLRAFGSAA